jgi:RNA polymerase-binding transcription factor DksA
VKKQNATPVKKAPAKAEKKSVPVAAAKQPKPKAAPAAAAKKVTPKAAPAAKVAPPKKAEPQKKDAAAKQPAKKVAKADAAEAKVTKKPLEPKHAEKKIAPPSGKSNVASKKAPEKLATPSGKSHTVKPREKAAAAEAKTALSSTGKSGNVSVSKPAKSQTLKKNMAEEVVTATNGKKKAASVKARSHHLMKILALREARKIKKPEDSRGGASEAVVVKPSKNGTAAATPVATKAEVAPPKPKKAPRRKAPYSKSDIRELRKLLEDERERLLRDLRSLDDLADSNRETTHATFSSHQADAASDSSSLESTFIQRRMEEERFAWVTEALVRIDKGTYGLCDLCADEPSNLCDSCPYIPIDRLRAKPHAKMCVPLRVQMEKRNKR